MAFFLGVVRALLISVLVSAALADKCHKPKVRKEWRALSSGERANWIDAVNVHSVHHSLSLFETLTTPTLSVSPSFLTTPMCTRPFRLTCHSFRPTIPLAPSMTVCTGSTSIPGRCLRIWSRLRLYSHGPQYEGTFGDIHAFIVPDPKRRSISPDYSSHGTDTIFSSLKIVSSRSAVTREPRPTGIGL